MKSIVIVAVLALPSVASAESYLERKDTQNLATIERAISRSKPNAALFDGTKIPAGANIRLAQQYLDGLLRDVKTGLAAARQLSADGRRRPKAPALLAELKNRADYANRMVAAFNVAAAQAKKNDKANRAQQQRQRKQYFETCRAFREQLSSDDRNALKVLVALSRGNSQLRVTGRELAPTVEKVRPLCARPEYRNIGAACGVHTNRSISEEGEWCAALKNADQLLASADRFRAQQKTDSERKDGSVESLKSNEGWVRKQGAPRWSLLDATPTLKASVKALAPTWPLPGRPCAGPHCAPVKRAIDRLYGPSAKIMAVRQRADWKVVQNRLGIPTHRYRKGYVLVQVAKEPFCQLRSWTQRETHQGGGRYVKSASASIGYVRWQSCL